MNNEATVEDYKRFLKSYVCHVAFEKLDGTTRNMKCTTDMTRIGSRYHPKGDSTKAESEEQVNVFDVDKQAWR